MGELAMEKLAPGRTVRIWTGGALPEGADAVVMVEHTQNLDDHTVEIFKAVAPFENVVRRGEDFKRRQTLLKSGHRVRPQDVGLLAAMGTTRVSVYRRPRVGIMSSGDEIVPIEVTPPPGCMRDVNRHALAAAVREAHADPVWLGIVPDRAADMDAAIRAGLDRSDLVLISGGSSMGSRDLVIDCLERQEQSHILFHGVSLSPGKPLILGRVGNKPLVGLPGHPVSALVCFDQFVAPLLRRLEGEDVSAPYLKPVVWAVLSRNLPSQEGRTDFVRVRLERNGEEIRAMPVLSKSGMISGMVRSDGCIRISANCEGLYKGDRVPVELFSNSVEDSLETEHLS